MASFQRESETVLQGNPELIQRYDSIIKDQLKKEIIEEVNDRTEEGCKMHYGTKALISASRSPTCRSRCH